MSFNSYSDSKNEILKDDSKALHIYHKLLSDVYDSLSIGCVDEFEEKIGRVVNWCDSIEEETLEACRHSTPVYIKNTNIITLVCKYAKIGILHFLIGRGNDLFKKFIFRADLKHILKVESNNCLYYAIRSNNAELLDLLSQNYKKFHLFVSNFSLNNIISESYRKFMLRNVNLSSGMKSYLERTLINIFYIVEDERMFEISISSFYYFLDYISEFFKGYKKKSKADAELLRVVTFSAETIHLLKQHFFSTNYSIPWEEMEFCLLCFISSLTKRDETNLHIRQVLSNRKILAHLENFSACLEDELKKRYRTVPAKQSRKDVRQSITKKDADMKELYNDYKQVRDVYSLDKMRKYINLVISADVRLKVGQLTIKRALQVIIEHLKPDVPLPKLSLITRNLLITSGSKSTRETITNLIVSESLDNYISKWSEFEEDKFCEFYQNVQNHLEKMGVVITSILNMFELKAVRDILMKFSESKDQDEVNETAELFCHFGVQRIISGSHTLIEHNGFGIHNLVQKMDILIPDKTFYENSLFDQISDILELEETQQRTKLPNNFGIQFLKRIVSRICDTKPTVKSLKSVKYLAKEIMECCYQRMTPKNLELIAKSTKEIWSSVRPRLKSDERNELDRLFLEICHILCFGSENVEVVDELEEALRAQFVEKSSSFHQGMLVRQETVVSEDTRKKLNDKLEIMKDILSYGGYGDYSGYLIIPVKKVKERHLAPALETLILDVIRIWENGKTSPTHDIYFNYYHLFPIVGIFKLNHLEVDKEFIEAFLSFSEFAAIGMAKRIIESKGFTKLITMFTLKERLQGYPYGKYNKTTDEYQAKLFESLEAGIFTDVKDYLCNGADLSASSLNSRSALHFAAMGRSPEGPDIVKFILSENVSPHVRDDIGRSALHIAAANGRKSIVEYFVGEVKMNVDLVDDYGRTPLHFASFNGHLDVVKLLWENKARISSKDAFRQSPLHYATQNNHVHVVKFLRELMKRPNANEVDEETASLLVIAAEMGNLEMVNYLAPAAKTQQKCVVDHNSETDGGLKPLHVAAKLGHLDVVKALISHDFSTKEPAWNGYLPIHHAVENNHINVVEFLLDKEEVEGEIIADILRLQLLKIAVQNANEEIVERLLKFVEYPKEITETLKPTALHVAALNGRISLTKLLIEKGFEVNSKDSLGNTPLHNSCLQGFQDVSICLVHKGADISLRNSKGLSPLQIAIKSNHFRFLEYLKENFFLFHLTNNSIENTFYLSILHGNFHVCENLLRTGADINARDHNMNTPLHIAAQTKDMDVFEYLLREGASVTALNDNGFTPFHITAFCGHEKKVAKLIDWVTDKALVRSDDGSDSEVNSAEGLPKRKLSAQFRSESPLKRLPRRQKRKQMITKYDFINSFDKNGFTPLCAAVEGNYTAVVEMLLTEGADVNLGQPIAIAVSAGYEEIVDILLKTRDIDVSYHQERVSASYSFICNCTLLHAAAKNGNKHITETLLSKVTHVDHTRCVFGIERLKAYTSTPTHSRKSLNDTALHLAAVNGHSDVVQVLLENGADCNKLDEKGRTPLELAISGEHLQVVRTLLHSDGSKSIPCTCLNAAAKTGNVGIAKLLIDGRREISLDCSIGERPTHIAAEHGHLSVLKYFLENGYDIKDCGANGWTLLHYAANGGSMEVASFLMEEKLDPNSKDNTGNCPINLAIKQKHRDVVRLLLRKGALCVDPELRDSNDSWRLVKAVMNEDASEVERCLKEGALINSRYGKYHAVLNHAARKGLTRVAEIMECNKGNPRVVKRSGFTPLHFAAMTDNASIVKTLLANGAVYNMDSECGRTCADFAKNKDITDLLNLVDVSFTGVENADFRFIDKLQNLEDTSLLKAVMGAKNLEGKSLIVFANTKNFQESGKLKLLFERLTSTQRDNARELRIKRHFKEALDILEKILDETIRIFGPHDLKAIGIQENIAELHEDMFNYKNALEIYQDAHAKLGAILGQTDEYTLRIKTAIAFNLLKQKKWEEALEVARKLINTEKQLSIMSLTASALCNLGKVWQAITLPNNKEYKDVLQMSIDVYMDKKKNCSFEETWIDVKTIAMVLHKQNRFRISFLLLQNLFTLQKEKLGPDDMETLNTQTLLGDMHYDQGKYMEAFETYSDVLGRRQTVLGPNHQRVIDCSTKLKMLKVILKESGSKVPENRMLSSQASIVEAAANGDVKTVEDMTNAGIHPDTPNRNGHTALHLAVYNCHMDVVSCLLDKGANALESTTLGNTVLHIAAYKDSVEIVALLLHHTEERRRDELKQFVNKENAKGLTALDYAAMNNSFDIAKSLLKHGAKYKLKGDTECEAPLELFVEENFLDLLDVIGEIFESVQSDSSDFEKMAVKDGMTASCKTEVKEMTPRENIDRIIEKYI